MPVRSLCREELGHAKLAWRTLLWGVKRYPELRPALMKELDEFLHVETDVEANLFQSMHIALAR